MSWDFSEETTANLETIKTNIRTKLNELLTGVQSGNLDGAGFSQMTLEDLRELQGAVNAELRARDDSTGAAGFIAIEFEDAD